MQVQVELDVDKNEHVMDKVKSIEKLASMLGLNIHNDPEIESEHESDSEDEDYHF